MNKKLISFSLWGDNPLYCNGAVKNVLEAKEIYPDWTCRFYVSTDCPVINKLKTMDCEVVEMQPFSVIDHSKDDWTWQKDHTAMFWRFYAMSEPVEKYERVIFRDTDSIVNWREKAAVDEWIESDMLAHRMHECKEHWNAPIMGGMWGIKCGVIKNSKHIIDLFIKTYPQYNEPWMFVDLIFIREKLIPYIKNSLMGHGFGHENNFPCHKPIKYGSFVGECIKSLRNMEIDS